MANLDQTQRLAQSLLAHLPSGAKFWLSLIVAILLVVQFSVGLMVYGRSVWFWGAPFSLVAPAALPCALLWGASMVSLVLTLRNSRYALRVTLATLIVAIATFAWQIHFGAPDMTTTPIGRPQYEYHRYYFTWWWYSQEVRLYPADEN